MAIDTNNEKFALIDMGDVWADALPISSDDLGQDDKQHLLWEYPGILWGIIGGLAILALGDAAVAALAKGDAAVAAAALTDGGLATLILKDEGG